MGAVCNRQVKIQSNLVYNLAFLLQKCQTFAVLAWRIRLYPRPSLEPPLLCRRGTYEADARLSDWSKSCVPTEFFGCSALLGSTCPGNGLWRTYTIIVPPSHPTSPVPSNTEAVTHPLPKTEIKNNVYYIFLNNYVVMQSCWIIFEHF